MSDPRKEELNILVPIEAKGRMDYIHRTMKDPDGFRITRRQVLGLGGAALLAGVAAACGTTTTSQQPSPTGSAGAGAALAGKPVESKLQIYNWTEYDDPSTYKKFENLPEEKAAGLDVRETYYSSNDELLAKINAGAGGYDIIVPSQNAVAQLIQQGKLMALDTSLLPNLKYLEPSFLKTSYDPTGQYHVIKDYGITMFFYNNKIITEEPKTLKDFYDLLTRYEPKGRTNILDGPEEVVPLALMALGLDPNTDDESQLNQARDFLISVRKGVTTISSSDYINDGIAGKIILGQGWNGDVRRIVQGRKKQGDITPVIPEGASEIWSDNWCVPADAPHPVAAHHWIDWLLTPSTAVTEMEYHNYTIPIPDALDQLSSDLSDDPLFNVPTQSTDNYEYILNVSPQVVQARTRIYTEFKVA